jgi:hypothetical protein
VLRGYRPHPSLRAHVDAHLAPYRLLRYLAEIRWLLERGLDASASIEGARSLDPANG